MDTTSIKIVYIIFSDIMKEKYKQDLTGKIFGYWTVLKLIRDNDRWLFRCKCGKEKVVSIYRLINGTSKSCGCYRKEQLHKIIKEENPMSNPEIRKKHKAIMNDPVFRAKRSKLMKEVNNRPEVKAKHKEYLSRPEVKERISLSMKEIQSRPEIRTKMDEMLKSEEFRESNRQRMLGENNPMNRCPEVREEAARRFRSPENREKVTAALNRPEVLKKLSDSKLGDKNPMKLLENRIKISGRPAHDGSGRGKGSYFNKKDGDIVWLRSTYETRFATILDHLNIEWKYEVPISLYNTIWHPDFYLPTEDLFIEVKGWITADAKKKLFLVNDIYPNINLIIVELCDIELLETGISLDKIGTPLKIFLQQMVQQ